MFKLFLNSSLFILLFQSCVAQNNMSLTITPVKPILVSKINSHLEYLMKNDLAITLEFQKTFSNSETKILSFKSLNGPMNDKKTKNGSRFLLGIRSYDISEENEKKSKFTYIGISGFIGRHSIVVSKFSLNEREELIEKSGSAKLISYGVSGDVGVRKVYQNGVIINWGLICGYAWNNQEESYFWLTQNGQLENSSKQKIDREFSDLFLEPHFSIGINF